MTMKLMTGEQYRAMNEIDGDTVSETCDALAKEIMSDNGKSYWIPKRKRNLEKYVTLDERLVRHVVADVLEVCERDKVLRKRFLKWLSPERVGGF